MEQMMSLETFGDVSIICKGAQSKALPNKHDSSDEKEKEKDKEKEKEKQEG